MVNTAPVRPQFYSRTGMLSQSRLQLCEHNSYPVHGRVHVHVRVKCSRFEKKPDGDWTDASSLLLLFFAAECRDTCIHSKGNMMNYPTSTCACHLPAKVSHQINRSESRFVLPDSAVHAYPVW